MDIRKILKGRISKNNEKRKALTWKDYLKGLGSAVILAIIFGLFIGLIWLVIKFVIGIG